VHSLHSKVFDLYTLLCNVKVSFDIIVLSEIWSTSNDYYHNILKGYTFYYDLPVGTHVGGLGMFIK